MSGAHIVTTGLNAAEVLTSWRFDAPVLVVVAALGFGYWRARRGARRRGFTVPRVRACCFFLVGLGVWLVASASFIGTYADTLFWVRALQFVLLLFVAPFGLAVGTPVAAARESRDEHAREVFDRFLASAPMRLATHPAVTGASMLALPWLVYLTGWYPALLANAAVDQGTRFLLVLVGFTYFFSRLQSDPTPRKYPQLVTLLLSIGESVADGVLGLTLALGPLIAPEHYAARGWGPSLRMDQVIGAGVLWILGDVVGVPFVMAVMRSLRAEERRVEASTDAELDRLEEAGPQSAGLWWENDPQLRDRFRN